MTENKLNWGEARRGNLVVHITEKSRRSSTQKNSLIQMNSVVTAYSLLFYLLVPFPSVMAFSLDRLSL